MSSGADALVIPKIPNIIMPVMGILSGIVCNGDIVKMPGTGVCLGTGHGKSGEDM